MPKPNHSRKGVKRPHKPAPAIKMRCRFCRRVRSQGHEPGCIGAMTASFDPGMVY